MRIQVAYIQERILLANCENYSSTIIHDHRYHMTIAKSALLITVLGSSLTQLLLVPQLVSYSGFT